MKFWHYLVAPIDPGQTFRASVPVVFLASFLVMAGCSGNELGLVPVTGKVTLDGAPLPGAEIIFQPEGPGGRPSIGVTDEHGFYRLQYTVQNSGALPGTHRVSIYRQLDEVSETANSSRSKQLPQKYNEKTTLRVEVSSNNRTHDFDLTSEGD